MLRPFGLSCAALVLASCSPSKPPVELTAAYRPPAAAAVATDGPVTSDRTKFSESAYGPASERVTHSRRVPRGGGRRKLGAPYRINGKRYVPKLDRGYDKTGTASWYGPNFHGRRTANAEIYDQYSLSAAHPTMPLPSYARVTNVENGHSVIVRVNDRGPYSRGRIIDLSGAAAKRLDYRRKGLAKVRVRYLGPARLDGRDERYLARSFKIDRSTVRRHRWRSRFLLAYAPEPSRSHIPDPSRSRDPFAALERDGSIPSLSD